MEPIRRDMDLLSSSMATFAHINAHPESLALFFMLGVCAGLLLALGLLVTGLACKTRRHATTTPSPSPRKRLRESREEEEEEGGGSLREGDSEIPTVAVATGGGVDVFASAEELAMARRVEDRERVVREIWRNGQPDILSTGTGTIGRAHYH